MSVSSMTRERAIAIALDAMERRRRVFAVGWRAYNDGFEGIWTMREHEKYEEMIKAIEVIRDVGEQS
jgi:hypothetical protein